MTYQNRGKDHLSNFNKGALNNEEKGVVKLVSQLKTVEYFTDNIAKERLKKYYES